MYAIYIYMHDDDYYYRYYYIILILIYYNYHHYYYCYIIIIITIIIVHTTSIYIYIMFARKANIFVEVSKPTGCVPKTHRGWCGAHQTLTTPIILFCGLKR